MDDDMEDEIVYELFTAHLHIIWRYLGVTSAGLVELVMPGPGETFKTKIFQPGPFMFLMFLVLVASVVLQSSSHLIRHWLIRAPYLLRLNSVADSTFRKIGAGLDLASSSSENVIWEFSEGIAGVYGMQGRRGNMEDRFAVLQDVDVGGKMMSFFGVYDGHGGQLSAEYVKENLFRNTIEKIRQLRAQVNNGDNPKNSSSTSVKRNNSKNSSNCVKRSDSSNYSNCVKRSDSSSKRGEKWGPTCDDSKDWMKGGSERDDPPPASASGSDNKLECEKSEEDISVKTSSKEAQTKSNGVLEGKDESQKEPVNAQSGSGIENLSHKLPETPTDVPLKRDDAYSNFNLLKRNSVTKASVGGVSGGQATTQGTTSSSSSSTTEPQDNSSGYIDLYGNLNYTRLLTDQILAIDKQVVQLCKSRTDMSGTTAVVGVLEGELLVIANVGDSRAVMGDLRGFATPLSFDHKPNQLKERRRIKEAGGFISFTGVWRVAGVLATSRALGDFTLKEPRPLITAEPDVLTFSLRDHKAQFVILATDGLWDVVTNEEAVEFIIPRLDQPDHGAAALARHAHTLGSQDNITVAILTLGHLTQ